MDMEVDNSNEIKNENNIVENYRNNNNILYIIYK